MIEAIKECQTGFLFPPRESVISSGAIDIDDSRGQGYMTEHLLIRNVPKHIRSWAERERARFTRHDWQSVTAVCDDASVNL